MKTKFKYSDKVIVINGFWEGFKGLINDCSYDTTTGVGSQDIVNNIQYEVILELGKKDCRNVYLKESWLKNV